MSETIKINNSYERNILAWLIGLSPDSELIKNATEAKLDGDKIIIRTKCKIDTSKWRMCYGSIK